MTDATDTSADTENSGFASDELVDTIAAFVCLTAIVCGMLWYVVNG